MSKIISKFTVYFEEPFWVGVFERQWGRKYEICKVTFGAEPKDYEIYDFFLKNERRLKFSNAIATEGITDKYINPKRMQRAISRQLENTGVGTKAQRALKLQMEENKLERKKKNKALKEENKEKQFQLKKAKRKEKHRGH